MAFKISVERNALRFSAAHFATFGAEAEPLHGHNYDVTVEIEGALSEDGWVLDFSVAKKLAAGLCERLDHRFILPLENRLLAISETEQSWEIGFGARRYAIPKDDVCALPISNSTAEQLAQWFCSLIQAELLAIKAVNITSITVGVEEAPGQSGWYTAMIAHSG